MKLILRSCESQVHSRWQPESESCDRWEEPASSRRFPLVHWNPQLLLAAAFLQAGCASAARTLNSSETIGVSSSPSVLTADDSEPSAKTPPTPDPALSDGAPAKTASAYAYLLAATDLALGDECGAELGHTSAWRALSVLVRDRRPEMLWDLTARASAPESRVAAVLGLAKLRTISYADAGALLRHMPGTITVCRGSNRAQKRPDSATELLSHLLDGEANALAMP